MTKEQIYREQLQALGIYDPAFEPEISTLARIEREYTRAQKAWSETAQPRGSRPSFLDPHFAVIQKLRAEILQHREALGLTPKALRKLVGAAGSDAPAQKDLITEKLDRIAARVSEYTDADEVQISQDEFILPEDLAELAKKDPYDEIRAELREIVAEDLG